MDPRLTVVLILVLCLLLIIPIYILGVEVGAASKLRTHPGYEATRASLAL
jgi:hypothetical protein